MAQIICDRISLSYESKKVLTDLSFSVDSGSYLSIVGKNGSGKSTLVRALLGLKEVSAGTITYGDNLDNRCIGYLPQHTNIRRDFPASVREVVLSGCRDSFLRYSRAELESAEKNMEMLGIKDIASRSFAGLSGGQRQRVLLARALCATKSMLLLDEPTAGLDPLVTAELYELIAEINKTGITVITVSHDLTAAMKYSSHILHLGEERNFFGTVHEYEHSDIGHYYLGSCD